MRIFLRPLPVLLLIAVAAGFAAAQQSAPAQQSNAPAPPPLKLTSNAFLDSTTLPPKYSCNTQPVNISPPLAWSDVPKGTASFVLIFHDMEPRPNKSLDDVLHWMMWNIPASTTELREGVPSNSGELPDGSRQTNGRRGDSGNFGYRGACAPPGIPHHYTFELFALDQKLNVPAEATRADVNKAMDGHIIGHAVLVGLFHR